MKITQNKHLTLNKKEERRKKDQYAFGRNSYMELPEKNCKKKKLREIVKQIVEEKNKKEQ